MKKTATILLGLLTLALLPITYAAAPVDTTAIAPVEDLKAEATAKVTALEELVGDAAKFDEAKKRAIPQAAGVLACVAQAIAEHKDREKSKVAAADLRDAALAISKSGSQADAAKALATAKGALEGKSDGKAKPEAEWNKLINMHRMMNEFESRNAKIRIALRKPKNPEAESLHATTLAVLAVALHADTHEVKDPAQLPKWHEFSESYRKNLVELAAAMKAKDKKAADIFKAAQKSCADCHGVFRKEE